MEGTVRAPVTKKSYQLEAACTSRTPGLTLTLTLLNATSERSLTTQERLIASTGVSCDGQPTLIGYGGGILPRTIIQIAISDDTNDLTSLYAVLTPG
ncbi:MAG: hypothetical protein QOF57_1484 [Frankiaceae bacterium]|jgi:hypothetical protein|nr:hypothetical protein [Frankiaceae bacterium]